MCFCRGAPAPASGASRSLLAQRVQLKVSPTKAEPKESGRLTAGERMKGSGFVSERV